MAELQYPQFGGYSLQDEDEEEKRRRRLQELQALQTPNFDPNVAPPGPPMRGALSSLIAPRDPEMESRWRGAEQQALSRSGYQGDQPYGAGEAVRDFAPMVVGGALDGLLNKGRGLGALAGAGMQANQIEEARRQKQAQSAGDFALSARNQRDAQGRSQLGVATEERQQAQFDMLNNPDHPAAKAYAQKLLAAGVPEELVMGQSLGSMRANQAAYTPYFRHDTAGLTNSDAANRAGGVKRAQQGVADEHFPTELDQAGQKSEVQGYAGARGGLQAGLDLSPQTNAAAAAKEGATTTAGEAAKEASPRVYRENAEKFQTTQKVNLDMVGLMDEIDHGGQGGYAPTTVAERFGNALASYGIPPDRLPTWTAKKFLLEEWGRAQTGAVINDGETKAFLQQLGQHPLQSEESVNAAYGQFQKLIHRRIAGAATGNPAARDVLRSYTSDPDSILGGGTVPRATPRRDGPSTAAPGQAFNVPGPGKGDNPLAPGYLDGVNPGGDAMGNGPTPKVPLKPGGMARMRTVVAPDGSTEQVQLTDEEAQYLESQGGKVR